MRRGRGGGVGPAARRVAVVEGLGGGAVGAVGAGEELGEVAGEEGLEDGDGGAGDGEGELDLSVLSFADRKSVV